MRGNLAQTHFKMAQPHLKMMFGAWPRFGPVCAAGVVVGAGPRVSVMLDLYLATISIAGRYEVIERYKRPLITSRW